MPERDNHTNQNRTEKLLGQPFLGWILVGFLASYLLFFVRPIFQNPQLTMAFPRYIPAGGLIGGDFANTLTYSRSWLIEHESPYAPASHSYPPLSAVLFSPLVLVPYRSAYLVLSLLTIAAYLFSTLSFTRLTSMTQALSPILLLAVTGFLSYGFQFELERGQFNVMAMALGLAAVGLFYWKPRWRLASYLLLTLAIQLKVYPAILILAFVSNWRNWKREGLRILGIVILNVACLFILGPRIFLDFVAGIKSQMLQPNIGNINHSAASFAAELAPSHTAPLELAILVVVLASLAFAVWHARVRRWPGLDPYLILACTIGALIIPSVSYDYTLPLLTAPAAIFFSSLHVPHKGLIRALLGTAALLFMSLAYSSTLFSFTNKTSLPLIHGRIPAALTESTVPALLLVLLAASMLVGLGFLPSAEASVGDAPGSPPGSQ